MSFVTSQRAKFLNSVFYTVFCKTTDQLEMYLIGRQYCKTAFKNIL